MTSLSGLVCTCSSVGFREMLLYFMYLNSNVFYIKPFIIIIIIVLFYAPVHLVFFVLLIKHSFNNLFYLKNLGLWQLLWLNNVFILNIIKLYLIYFLHVDNFILNLIFIIDLFNHLIKKDFACCCPWVGLK